MSLIIFNYQSCFAVSFTTLLKANMLIKKVSSVYVSVERRRQNPMCNEWVDEAKIIRRKFIHKNKLKWSSLLNFICQFAFTVGSFLCCFCVLNSSEFFCFRFSSAQNHSFQLKSIYGNYRLRLVTVRKLSFYIKSPTKLTTCWTFVVRWRNKLRRDLWWIWITCCGN